MFFSYLNNPYIAIIGDIKNSKKIKDRNKVQNSLKTILNRINDKYIKDIASKFMITLGDEFQGLLSDGSNVMNIVDEIQREMYPVMIRFGVGVGSITTEINLEMAIGADGPGYYKARQAIEFLKKNEQKNKTYVPDIRIEIESKDEESTELMDTVLSLMSVIKYNWTQRQREIIWDAMEFRDGQKKSAERLNVAQSSIQRGLSNGNYYAYKDAFDIISKELKALILRKEDKT